MAGVDRIREDFRAKPAKAGFDVKNGFSTKFFSENPTFLSYKIVFDFSSPLFQFKYAVGESAERFFERRSDEYRRDLVIEFRERMQDLMHNTPYLIKGVSGLNNMLDFNGNKTYQERDVIIDTYETLDMRLSQLAHIYTNIVWDFKHQVRVLPANLCWVTFCVVVHDIRSLVKYVKNDFGDDTLIGMNKYLPSHVYTFTDSQFNFGSSNPFVNSMSGTDVTMSENTFKMSCGKFDMTYNQVALYDLIKTTTILHHAVVKELPEETHPSLFTKSKDKLIAKLKDKAVDTIVNEITKAEMAVMDTIKALKFAHVNGNVLFGAAKPNALKLITGEQKPRDLIRFNLTGDYTREIEDIILHKPVLGDPQSEFKIHKKKFSYERSINELLEKANEIQLKLKF